MVAVPFGPDEFFRHNRSWKYVFYRTSFCYCAALQPRHAGAVDFVDIWRLQSPFRVPILGFRALEPPDAVAPADDEPSVGHSMPYRSPV